MTGPQRMRRLRERPRQGEAVFSFVADEVEILTILSRPAKAGVPPAGRTYPSRRR